MKAYEVHATKSAFSMVSIDAFAFFRTALTVRKLKIIVGSYSGLNLFCRKSRCFLGLGL